MPPCTECQKLIKQNRRGKPHQDLSPEGDPRIFKGARPRGFEEQDYRCLSCQSRFTHSTSRNDLTWTLWQN